MIEIVSRYDKTRVLYKAETAQDVRAALKEAVASGAYLRDADLRGADLRDADLRGADLRGADLGGAYLRDAYLRDAYLRDAYLRGADLRGADLRDAYLRGAYLRGAYLGGAYLGGADLRGADLGGAYLRGAYLGGADLRGADLGGAYLGGAYLGGAYLRGADLRGAYLRDAYLGDADETSHRHPLWMFRADYMTILDTAPAEAPAVRQALLDGKVNGSTYRGDCCCLVGTIANAADEPITDEIPELVCGIKPDSSRPAEQWFLGIKEGDTADPAREEHKTEGEFRATVALRWLDEWVESRTRVGKVLA